MYTNDDKTYRYGCNASGGASHEIANLCHGVLAKGANSTWGGAKITLGGYNNGR